MLPPSLSTELHLQMLAILDGVPPREAFPGLTILHVCENTYLIDGAPAAVMAFLTTKYCVDSCPSRYPQDIWRREYKYLGDIPVGKHFLFDLRLREKGEFRYFLDDDLPDGCSFLNGLLSGNSKEATQLLTLNIEARNATQTFRERFQIRFFEHTNIAPTFTAQNYLRHGYGPQLLDYSPSETYFRIFESTNKTLRSPFEEAKTAALEVQSRAGDKPIHLFVSGGIDSQCMVQAFIAAKVPFRPILMVDSSGANQDDVDFSLKFFASMNQAVEIYNLDFVQFIKDYKYVDMANRYRFNNPEYGILLHLIEKFGGHPVYAGRPISIGHDIAGRKVIGLAADETWSRSRFFERAGIEGTPEFLIHTPELMESFFQTPVVQNFSNDQEWLYPQKLQLLRESGFNTQWAPPNKITGFENLEILFPRNHFGNDLWLHHRGPLKLRYPHGSIRNAMPLEGLRIGSATPSILRPYKDGLSYAYLQMNSLSNFH